jgi:hypothetical protein
MVPPPQRVLRGMALSLGASKNDSPSIGTETCTGYFRVFRLLGFFLKWFVQEQRRYRACSTDFTKILILGVGDPLERSNDAHQRYLDAFYKEE